MRLSLLAELILLHVFSHLLVMVKRREEKVVEELMNCLIFGLHSSGLHALSLPSMLLCVLYMKYENMF